MENIYSTLCPLFLKQKKTTPEYHEELRVVPLLFIAFTPQTMGSEQETGFLLKTTFSHLRVSANSFPMGGKGMLLMRLLSLTKSKQTNNNKKNLHTI